MCMSNDSDNDNIIESAFGNVQSDDNVCSTDALNIENNAMNIKKTIPFTGQDSPKSKPDKMLSRKYFLFKFNFY